MRKFIFNIAILILVAILLVFFNAHLSSLWISFLVNILAAVFLFFLDTLSENFDNILLYIVTHTYFYKDQFRLSISYLYRIKIGDRFLLVKGKRVPNQYQPVGGVYKRFRESFYQLQKLGVTDDDNVPIDDKSIDDLRIKLPAKNVPKFINWFNSQLGREVSPGREFHEELISTGILSNAIFPYPNYLYLGRHQSHIHYSKFFKCYEILIAELFELKPNEKQIAELKRLMEIPSDEYIWVKEDEITRLGAVPNGLATYTIAVTATWLI